MRGLQFLLLVGAVGCSQEHQVHDQGDKSPTEAAVEDSNWLATGEASYGANEASPHSAHEPLEQLDLAEDLFEIEIAPALFEMGMDPSDEDYDAKHTPHMVELTHDWAITETEITNAQFEEVMGYNPAESMLSPDSPSACATCPVGSVSWHEAQAFGNALSRLAGLTECFTCEGDGADIQCEAAVEPYDCNGFRLPTEAEWEHAARGGEDFTYPGSNDIDEIAYWIDNSGDQAYPVASKLPNGFGLYDMGGNIRERVYDADHGYSGVDEVNPVRMPVFGEGAGELLAERGGSFACRRPEIRWNRRNLVWDYDRDVHTGFRVARILD